MNILQRYIFKEWFLALLAVSFLLLVVLMGVFLGELLNDMADGRIPAGLLGMQMYLHLPHTLGNVLPLSAFVAVMWGLGRLYRDHEMVVMRSSGFGWRNLIRPLVFLAFPVSLVLAALMLLAAPKALEKSEVVLEEAFRSAAIWGLQPGKFHIMQGGNLVVYVEAFDDDGRGMRNVFVRQSDGRLSRVWQAARGEYWMDEETGNRYLKLTDGQITATQPRSLAVRVLSFERNDIKLPELPRKARSNQIELTPTVELLGRDDREAQAELQWRLSPVLAVIVLSLLAIPLSHSDPREGRGSRIVMGVLAYALYANLLYLCRGWIADGTIPPVFGTWWVHAVVFLAALFWLHRQGRMVGQS